MSDYRRGKGMVSAWASHWDAIADIASARTTIEAKMVEYRQSIRTAFSHSEMPELLMVAMPPYIRVTHRCIMGLPVPQREAVLVWHFGDNDERLNMFGRDDREPSKLNAIYKGIGRRRRNAQKKPWAIGNLCSL